MKRLLKYVASAAMLLSPFGRSRRQGPAAPCVQLDRVLYRRKYWRRLGQQQLCEMIAKLATEKHELFSKLAQHYKVLASEVERAINENEAG